MTKLFAILLCAVLTLSACSAAEMMLPEENLSPVRDRLQTHLSRAEILGFSGSVLVAHGDDILVEAGYGLADREHKLTNRGETLFDIGSITKLFTAIAILQLEEAGKLSTEDTLADYFPDVPGEMAGITLDLLLYHRAGLIDFIGSDFETIDRDEMLQRLFVSELLTEPGTEWSYSNVGYGVLAAVIELVSGQSYTSYISEQIFEPAGMADSGFYGDPRWLPEQVAHGYSLGQDSGAPTEWHNPQWGLVGAGGIVSNGGDMLRWQQALHGGRLLSAAGLEKLMRPRLNMGNFGNIVIWEIYGAGIAQFPDGRRLLATTGGSDSGFMADYRYYLDDELTIIVMTNSTDVEAPEISRALADIVLNDAETTLPALSADAAPDIEVLEKYAGDYELESGGSIRIFLEDGTLYVGALDQAGIALLAATNSEISDSVEIVRDRTLALVAATADGDRETIIALMDGAAQSEQIDDEIAFFAELQQEHGLFIDAEFVGAAQGRQGETTLFVRLNFAERSLMGEFGWFGPELGQLRIDDFVPLTSRLFALSTARFVSGALEPEERVEIEFRGEADGIVDLVISAGAVTAVGTGR